MAIAPVSGINSYKGFKSSINFEGKKEENNNNKYSSGHTTGLKAVPVIVLMAMSPLVGSNVNASNRLENNKNTIELVESAPKSLDVSSVSQSKNKGNVIETKRFFERDTEGTKEGVPVYGEFKLISSDKNKNNFETINLRITRDYFDEWHDEDVEGPVVGFSRVNLKIIGEDGLHTSTAAFRQIVIKDEKSGYNYTVSRNDMCDYVENILKSDNNNSGIKMTEINRNVRPSTGGGIQNVAPDTTWYEKARVQREYFGQEINSAEVTGTHGQYTLRAYCKENDGDNFDCITIQKKGGPILQVKAVKNVNDKCYNLGYIGNITYGQIDVIRKNLGTHAIIDSGLANILKRVTEDKRFNNAYEVTNVEESTIVDERAIVADLD